MSFMHACAKVEDAQYGLKGRLVLVPGDLSKVQSALSQRCDDKYLIPFALKRRLKVHSINKIFDLHTKLFLN